MDQTTDAAANLAKAPNRFGVIPTPIRLDADPSYTGKGVTIAFLDSGFYMHPDLTEPDNRIIAFEDISKRRGELTCWGAPKPWDWHGTQTSVAAAGNGHLSNGVYRGLASDAKVVLVKVGAFGKVKEEHIARGLEWVLENRERYNIRVVNISLGGDEDVPHEFSAADRAAEEAVRQGVTVVAAAGNSGCTPKHHTTPPGNSPSVITVGGYDDRNQLGLEDVATYCSSFGLTADGIVKPDIVAPAMWVAAPILPDTDLFSRAEALSQLAAEPDYALATLARPDSNARQQLSETVRKAWDTARLPESLAGADAQTIRAALEEALKADKIVAAHYQHVDGTSFAAPLVSSIVAQMLEANPGLAPRAIKHLLVSTAVRISGAPLMWQGFGVVRAGRAVELAKQFTQPLPEHYFQPPRMQGDKLVFYFHDNDAAKVRLVGDFNQWDPNRNPFKKTQGGVWRASIDPPPPGRYAYKLIVDEDRWVEDPSNGLKEADAHGGLNSILNID